MQKILVPLDGSEFGEHALPFARAIQARTGASIHLVHVHAFEPPADLLQNTPFQYEGVSMEAYEERCRDEERRYLREVASRWGEEGGGDVSWELLEGYVTEALERYAESLGVDLVVMTTHGRTGMSRIWVGSVADSLVRHTSFPVLLIRPEEGGGAPARVHLDHVLVSLDGSALGEQILEPALELTRAHGARMTLLSVVSPYRVFGARVAPLPTGHLEERLEKSLRYLDGIASRLAAEGVDVATRIEAHVSPARAILRVAEEERADVVALATHGYTGVRRTLLGSVTDKVLRAVRVPLLLQRPSEVAATRSP